jgi:hypothetical protein
MVNLNLSFGKVCVMLSDNVGAKHESLVGKLSHHFQPRSPCDCAGDATPLDDRVGRRVTSPIFLSS